MQDPLEPVLLFTRSLNPEMLVAVGIVPPSNDSSMKHSPSSPHFSLSGRIGRGRRIVFDIWNPLLLTPIE